MKKFSPLSVLLVLLAVSSGCALGGTKGETMEIKSAVFKDGESLPQRSGYRNENLSPQLEWSGAPSGTASFAMIVDDPDAPSGNWVHWVIYNIPGTVTALKEGVPKQTVLSDGSRQGTNDFNMEGYDGPSPPPGPAHRYVFTVYALDSALTFTGKVTRKELLRKMEGHILGKGVLTGLFKR